MVPHFLRCFECKQTIYKLTQPPIRGMSVSPAVFEGLNEQPDPSPLENPKCIYCGAFPFVYHNTGLQVETSDGELIPNDN